MAQGLGGILGNMFGMGQPQAQPPLAADPMQGMGLLGRLQYLREHNPEALMALGSGMMQGNMAGGFAAAGDQMAQHREKMMAHQEQQRSTNLTKRWLMTNKGMDEAQAEMAMSNPAILGQVLKGGDTTEFQERAQAAQQYGLDPNSEEGRSFILSGKLPEGPNMREDFGLSPIYGKDKDGNIVVMQPRKQGGLQMAELPEGVTLQPGVDKIDLGTAWGITDRSGQIISTIPKDLAGAEQQKALGGKMGDAGFDLPRVEQNAKQTLGILERMKTHPGREGSTGFFQGALPSRSSDQVDFQSLVDQTQGQSFLQAFQMLKGGGQITEIEGQKATDAISRLRNQRLSDEDYLRAIEDLESVVKAGLARARQQAGQVQAPAQGGGNATSTGVQWSIEP